MNDVACRNIPNVSIVVTLDVFHDDKSPLNVSIKENKSDISVTLEVSHADKSPLNDLAKENIRLKVVTLEVSHPEISSLNVLIKENKSDISVTLPTHHEFIGHPYLCATAQLLLLAQSWDT